MNFVALCAAMPIAFGGEPPKRIVVLPSGPEIRGRDGRAWAVKDRAAILAQLAQRPILLDENHASVHAAPNGQPSPAAGWLSDFSFTDQGLEAAVEWTPYGLDLFSKKAYRYVSPALFHTAQSASGVLGAVRGLHSVGLTNSPNLDLPALNSQDHTHMKLTAEQLQALGLAADATDEQIAAKIVAVVQAQPKAGVAPELGSVLSKIQDTLAGLVAAKGAAAPAAAVAGNATEPSEAHVIAVNAVVDSGIAAGKVAPGSREAFVKQGGSTLESLKLLQELIASLPVLVATNAGPVGGGNGGNGGGGSKLTPQQQAICKDLQVSEEEFLKSRSELTS